MLRYKNGYKRFLLRLEQSSLVHPGWHWQEPSMGLQVPLLVHKQVSAQALPNFPLGHTVEIHAETGWVQGIRLKTIYT